MGETHIAVRDEDAADAVRIIESHREQVGGGIVVPLPQEFDALEARIGYRFRDRGLLEHALTHKSKAHEDPSGGVADNESLEFLGDAVLGLVVAEALFRSFPTLQRRTEVEDQGQPGLDGVARGNGGAARARRAHDPRPRRREDRRPPQAGAARRYVRGADRGDLSRRRPRSGAHVPDARVLVGHRGREEARTTSAAITSHGCRSGCRRWAGRCRHTASRAKSVPTIASCFTSKCSSATS